MYSHFPPINLPGLEGKENQTSVKSTNLVLRKQAHFSGSQLSAELASGHHELRSSQHEICQKQPTQTTELKQSQMIRSGRYLAQVSWTTLLTESRPLWIRWGPLLWVTITTVQDSNSSSPVSYLCKIHFPEDWVLSSCFSCHPPFSCSSAWLVSLCTRTGTGSLFQFPQAGAQHKAAHCGESRRSLVRRLHTLSEVFQPQITVSES